jgi:hypothetical protein
LQGRKIATKKKCTLFGKGFVQAKSKFIILHPQVAMSNKSMSLNFEKGSVAYLQAMNATKPLLVSNATNFVKSKTLALSSLELSKKTKETIVLRMHKLQQKAFVLGRLTVMNSYGVLTTASDEDYMEKDSIHHLEMFNENNLKDGKISIEMQMYLENRAKEIGIQYEREIQEIRLENLHGEKLMKEAAISLDIASRPTSNFPNPLQFMGVTGLRIQLNTCAERIKQYDTKQAIDFEIIKDLYVSLVAIENRMVEAKGELAYQTAVKQGLSNSDVETAVAFAKESEKPSTTGPICQFMSIFGLRDYTGPNTPLISRSLPSKAEFTFKSDTSSATCNPRNKRKID